jgi:hypothetical protein
MQAQEAREQAQRRLMQRCDQPLLWFSGDERVRLPRVAVQKSAPLLARSTAMQGFAC